MSKQKGPDGPGERGGTKRLEELNFKDSGE